MGAVMARRLGSELLACDTIGISRMGDILIQQASSVDLEYLVLLRRQLYEDNLGASSYDEESGRRGFLELFRDPSLGRVWVGRRQDAIVGYVLLTFSFSLELDGRNAFIDELIVDRSCRGQGLGEALLAFAENAARELGIKAMHLEVNPANVAASRLYAKHGFVRRPYALMTRRL
jgi:ribosomal protein S18 acetylase RimI-like enzyme